MTSMFFDRLRRDTRGNVAILLALLLIPLALAIGTGVDYGRATEVRTALQGTADAAALAGANVYTSASAQTTATTLAQNYVTKGTAQLPAGTTITSTTITPGTSNNANTITVSIAVLVPTTFMKFYESAIPVSVSATAKDGTGPVCMLALDTNPNDIHSIFSKYNGTVNIGGNCGVADNLLNNKNTDSVDVKSGSVVNFASLYMRVASKCDDGHCQGTLNVTNPIQYSKPALSDPYSGRAIPTPSACGNFPNGGTNVVVTTNTTLYPGTYCGTAGNAAIAVNGGTVTLSPGVYILDGQGGGICDGSTGHRPGHGQGHQGPGNDGNGGGDPGGGNQSMKPANCNSGNFEVYNGATVTGNGVTIVLTTSTSNAYNIGNMIVDDSSSLSISAPTSNVSGMPVAGIAIWQDPNAPQPDNPGPGYSETDQGVNTIGSGASTTINGVIYFPSQAVVFSGGSGSDACTQIVAWAIQFLHGANFSYPSDCSATAGTEQIGSSPSLVQ